MYKLFFLNVCCLFLLIACERANGNSSSVGELSSKESNTAKNNSSIIEEEPSKESTTSNNPAAIQTTDELVLHFTGPIRGFDDIDFFSAPITKGNRTTSFKTIAPAFISQNECDCNQLATIRDMEYGYDYAMTRYEDSYLCDADGDGDQDFLVPIVCRDGDKVSITIAFINDSKDPDFFRIASNNFLEFPDGKGLPDCKE